MQLIPLGGGDEVGASCMLLQAGPTAVLLDAGLRPRPHDNTPAFASAVELVEDFSHVKAAFVTHAHLDHMGALPLVCQRNPGLRVYVAPNTKLLLRDFFRGMTRRLRNEKRRFREVHEVAEYHQQAVDAALAATEEVPFFHRRKVPYTSLHFEFWPAGHVLGSASVYLRHLDESLLYTGDVCDQPRASIQPLAYARAPVDHLVMESTYLGQPGDAAPHAEFARLYARVGEVTSKGGVVLVPTFALGKAQELAALFARSNQAADHYVPVYLDGHVKKLTALHEAASTPVPFKVKEPGHIEDAPRFRRDSDEFAKFVTSHPGCVILASSGMLLDESASAYWAQALAPEHANAIFFPGYLDPRSPGHIIASADPGDEVALNGDFVPLHCAVERFHVGTHASARGLVRLVAAIQPRDVLLVHGNPTADQVAAFRDEIGTALGSRGTPPEAITRAINREVHEFPNTRAVPPLGNPDSAQPAVGPHAHPYPQHPSQEDARSDR